MTTRTIVYSSLGALLEVFEVDLEIGALSVIQSLRFDCVIQYAWANRARTMIYVATSDSGPMAKVKLPNHFVQTFRILPTGALEAAQPPVRLRNRPLHLSLDRDEEHLLLAYNEPSDVTVHEVRPDGSVGDEVEQQPLYFGLTVHQVRVTPYGNIVVVPSCAHDDLGLTAGCVNLFAYGGGRLAPLPGIVADPDRVANWRNVRNGAQGFAARHVDFHPARPWMYLLLEAQGELQLYDYDEARVALEPRFIKSTLEGAPVGRSAQLASAVHVHPSGRLVYVTNRAWDTEEVDGKRVFVGGVNDITSFTIDQETGEPNLLEHVETGGIFPRTFGIDASGRLLVVGNQDPGTLRDDGSTRRVVPSLVVYRIGEDGRLSELSRHHHPDNGDVCFWVDVLTLDEDDGGTRGERRAGRRAAPGAAPRRS